MTDQPARYHRTPADIEAVQWTGTNTDALRAFAGSDFDTIDPEDRIEDPDQDAQLLVEASHWVGIKPGDWVVKYEGYFVAKADATFRAVWEPAAVSVPPPADQTALRRRIAEAVRRVPIKYGAGPDAYTIQPVSIEEADVIAAAVEAVLPPDDRAAALREAADVAVRAARGCGDSGAGQYAASVAAGIGKELRRVAAEEQPAETQARRGDSFEAWLKAQRDAAADHPQAYQAADGLLDLYRLHADTGTPLGDHVCEARVVGDCDCLEQPEPQEAP